MKASYIEWLAAEKWIGRGDCIYVISDVLELAKAYRARGERLGLDDLIEGLQGLVGQEGTLLFPAFNWDFCKGIAFDYHRTV